jgi:hypothetical protein
MARSFPLEEGGSATGVLITDRCHGPGGDGGGLLLFPFEEQSNNEQMDQIKASNVAGFALFAARILSRASSAHPAASAGRICLPDKDHL